MSRKCTAFRSYPSPKSPTRFPEDPLNVTVFGVHGNDFCSAVAGHIREFEDFRLCCSHTLTAATGRARGAAPANTTHGWLPATELCCLNPATDAQTRHPS